MERRAFLSKGALAGAAALSLQAPSRSTATPLRVGEDIGSGWTLEALKTGHAGAAVATLSRPDAESLRVMLTRADTASKRAMATTGRLDLVVLNNGDGSQPTPDQHVAAVNALARRLQGAEHSLPGADGLLTASERQRRFRPIDHDVI